MILTFLSVFIFFNLMFLIALRIKDNSIADIAWGIGFVIIAISLLLQTPQIQVSQIIISSLVIIWGLRLSAYIYIRSIGKGEDFRYANWRKSWGKNFIVLTYLRVFMLQMLIMFVIAIPLFICANDNIHMSLLRSIGAIIAVLGLVIESVSDYQMFVFKRVARNKGQILQNGLWRYSRHPNYFGESIFWWGIGIFAVTANSYYISLLSSALITFLLLNVSGIPMLEKKYQNNMEFQNYIARTSSFILWFPKK
jgi:steroid 5-alpha reductase family enzyme